MVIYSSILAGNNGKIEFFKPLFRSCSTISTKVCGTEYHKQCELVMKDKCSTFTLPKCSFVWAKKCKDVAKCKDVWEKVMGDIKDPCGI